MNNVAILGCGWLGLPLAKFWIQKGFSVNGSTTKPEKISLLEANSIKPFLLKLNPEIEGKGIDNFLNVSTLLINIPPQINLKKTDAHVEQIRNLLVAIKQSPIRNIIYTSATSVYQELNQEVKETDVQTPEQSASPILVKAENLLSEFCRKEGLNLTILRCGGLMGYDRMPAKYFAGWKGLTSGNTLVNYIHRDDVIGMIDTVLARNLWNETYNVVSPIHPTRKEVYEKNSSEFGFEMPEFVEPATAAALKIVSVEKFLKASGYAFKYPNPLEFYYEKQA